MLVLGRRQNETIIIEPGNIRITVTKVTAGGSVRIGIDAPPEYTVLREELVGKYGRLQAQAEREERERNGGAE
jgi:carbon storage regulator CsrA